MRRLWIPVAVLFALLVALNHGERALRVSAFQRTAGSALRGVVIPLVPEEGPGGHLQLTVDETSLDVPGETLFRFSLLDDWRFDPRKATPPPESVSALHGKRIAAAGFMRLGEGEGRTGHGLGAFYLVPSGQVHKHDHGDGHGPAASALPPAARRIRVELPSPVPLEHGKPVLARGVLYVDPGAKDGHVLLLEADRVDVTGDPPIQCPVGEALDLPLFDFFWLEELDYQEKRGLDFRIPDGMKALDGRRVRVEGFVMDAQHGPPPSFLLARSWWNGCCEGEPPTPFNSMAVELRKGTPLPPPWLERASYVGVLNITEDPGAWNRRRVARLENAVRAPEAGALGLRLPVWFEILLACAVAALVLALRFASRRSGHEAQGGPEARKEGIGEDGSGI